MRKIRIYHPHPIDPAISVALDDAARHHLGTVLRKNVGDTVYLFNDTDTEYLARISAISKKECLLEILESDHTQIESPLETTLYQALSRSDKMDWVIQKGVELGVNRVVPILTEYSQIKLNSDKARKKQAHWQAVAISACEQSGRRRVPRIELPQTLATAREACTAQHKLILHPHQGGRLADLAIGKNASIALFVGPEGGFSEVEVEQCLHQGFDCVRFGPRVLRTETAPLAILAALQAIWGDC